jgi:hypothetical protein
MLLGDQTAESGGNAGSDFVLEAHDDNGSLIGNALSFKRSTGLGTVIGDPTAALGIATKRYVDSKAGGTVYVSDTPPTGVADNSLWWESDTGFLYIYYNDGNSTQWIIASPQPDVSQLPTVYVSDNPPSNAPDNSLWWESDSGLMYLRYNDGSSTQWVITSPQPDTTAFLSKTGGTMTGPLTLSADPTTALQAAPKQYVDTKVDKAGDTMTGALILPADPVAAMEAATKQYVDAQSFIPPYYLGGMTLVYGNATSLFVRPGGCTSLLRTDFMVLNSNLTKTLAPWAVGMGNGGLDTGTINPNSWYHFYIIKRPDTGVVDAIFSTNAASPTMPANYTQYRRVGSFRTDASGNITNFSQVGDQFLFAVPILSYNNIGFTAGASTSYQLTTPQGYKHEALFNIHVSGGYTVNTQITYWSPDQGSTFGAFPVGSDLSSIQSTAASTPSGLIRLRTGVSANIYIYSNQAIGAGIYINSHGWYDNRDKG